MQDPIYAIGDVHGQLEMLEEAVALIEADGGPQARVVLLGDYIDRGPDSSGVVDYLMRAQQDRRPWVMLKGNHDDFLGRFLEDMRITDPNMSPSLTWLNPRVGGDRTLASYGIEAADDMPLEPLLAAAREAVPQAHVDFLRARPVMHRTGDKTFVHAGIRPNVALDAQEERDLLWIRKGFIDHPDSFGPLVVHGHTALDHPQHRGNRVNLDGGAGYFRPLHPAVFEGNRCWLLTRNGRVELPVKPH